MLSSANCSGRGHASLARCGTPGVPAPRTRTAISLSLAPLCLLAPQLADAYFADENDEDKFLKEYILNKVRRGWAAAA